MLTKRSMLPIISITSGSISAVLYVYMTSGSVFAVIPASFTLQPLLFIGLSNGYGAGVIAITSGVACAIISTNINHAMLYCLYVAFPAYIIISASTVLGKSTNIRAIPIGNIIIKLTIVGLFCLIALMIFFSTTSGGLPQYIEESFNKLIKAIGNSANLYSKADIMPTINQFIGLFPGIVISSWLLMTIINTLITQTILVKIQKLKPVKSILSEILVPEWIYWTLVVSAMLILIGSPEFRYFGRNVSIILFFPLFFVGLSVVHAVAGRFTSPRAAITMFYFLILISSWPILIAVFLGFFEKWNTFRQKLTSKKQKKD